MGGPNLEIFKFGFYLFTPIYIMVKFGDPEWYNNNVRPLKEISWPPYEATHQPPKTHAAIKEELARMKTDRIAKKGRQTSEPTEQPSITRVSEAASELPGQSQGEDQKRTETVVGDKRLV
ncbi:uncharacterized protein L203_104816 [Cryptococcus depauperatus CBS 7841]|uniref:Uncharacterized protein n=1 Tax=Cryptococcus depauperatus CBS 7841 TaxID=1295531 RepID=A0A1E3IQ45_9TREE|nr:hypothetical protein L203_01976 [Cryptococcus depauperatus CBS 7841]